MSHRKQVVIGLTGGIGSGKTAVSDLFAKRGIDIIDADVIAREVVLPGTPGLDAIVQRFGQTILQADGTLNRPALRSQVFASDEDKAWLNNLLHPLIREAMLQAIAASRSPYCILSVPLLIENGLDKIVSRVLVVDCPEALQLSRALKRDNSDEATIRSIMKSQATRQQRIDKSDDIIDNSASFADLVPQVEALHQCYLALTSPSDT